MGLLTAGAPLDWATTKKHAAFVRREGVRQFIRQYHKLSKASGAALYWGDEIEYTLVHVDPKTKRVGLLLMSTELLPYLQWKENHLPSCVSFNFFIVFKYKMKGGVYLVIFSGLCAVVINHNLLMNYVSERCALAIGVVFSTESLYQLFKNDPFH